MPSMTMWRRESRRCVLVIERRRFELRVVEGESVIRAERAKSADQAILMAEIWHIEDQDSIFGVVPPV